MPEKKVISWKELVSEMREARKELSLSEVLKLAGKEWKKIKDGIHNEYIAGKNAIFPKKKGKTSPPPQNDAETPQNDAETPQDDAETPSAPSPLTKSQSKKKEILPGHKGAPSITRPGKIDYRTHKGDKFYHRGNKLEDENIEGVKGRPYAKHKGHKKKNGTKKNGTKKNGTKKNGTKKNGTKKNGTKKNGTKKNGTKKKKNKSHKLFDLKTHKKIIKELKSIIKDLKK